MVNITINNKKITAHEGETIMEAARRNNINIPSLCWLEGIHKVGSCRICVVEVECHDAAGLMYRACTGRHGDPDEH